MRRVIIFFLFLAMHIFLYAQLIKFPFQKEQFSFYHARQLDFVENKGQWEQQVSFRVKLHETDIWFEKDRFVFSLLHPDQLEDFLGFKFLPTEEKIKRGIPDGMIDGHAYHMIFENAKSDVKITAEGQLPHHENYFLGNDPSRWVSEVGVYNKIIYSGLYDDIDLMIYEHDGKFKYDFIVAPGADPSMIVTRFEGTGKPEVINGQLLIPTSVNTMYHYKPFSYQIVDGNIVEVETEYKVKRNNVSFHFPKGYRDDLELIIDPVWVFGSYTGSTADNWGYTATYDTQGNLFAGGSVFNQGYPTTTGAFQVNFAGGVCDIAISKFNAAGTTLLYSSYLGGSGSEVPHSLIVNSQNELYVYGTTGSSNFPMAGTPFDNTFNGGTSYTLTNVIQFPNGSDIIIARFSDNGQQLLSSTYMGGNGNDGLNMEPPLRNNYADDCRGEILIDKNDNVYVVSTTASTNFPVTPGAFQTTFAGGDMDGIILKMDNALSSVIWASYLGGSGLDAIYSISLDKHDNPVVAGGTTSTNFPVNANAVMPNYLGGTCDGFITRISSNGNAILRSTYWGTNQYDQVYFVDLDKQNNVFVFGQTRDPNSTLRVNAAWWQPGGGQFISKLDPSLSSIGWSTVFGTGGGNLNISPTAFLVDYCNNIYLSGWGSPSLNFNSPPPGLSGTAGLPITSDAFQTTTDNNDYYFMAIRDDASALIFATFYGGSSSAEHVDGGTSRFDRMGKIYQAVCAGCGGHSDFPTTPGAWSATNNSTNCNMGVAKIDFELPVIVAEFSNNAPVCLPDAVQFTNESYMPNPGQASCYWEFGDGATSTNCSPTHVYSSSGLYNVMLVMGDLNSCNETDTIWHQVLVLSNSTDTIPDAHMCVGSFTQIGIPPYVGGGVTYQWSPSAFLSNTSISNPICTAPSTTIYTLQVSDGICTDTLTQRVNVYDIQVDAGPDTLICIFNHTLNATATGGGPNIEYHWSSNNQFTDWLNTSPASNYANITLTGPGWYYIQAYNQWCSAIDSVFIDFYSLGSDFSPTNPLCNGDCNGSLSVQPTGGTPPFSYLWNTGETTAVISNLCAGSYSVTISDSVGCESLGQYILTEPEPLLINYQITDIPCEVAHIGAVLLNVSGGTQPYSYLWNNGQTTNPAIGLSEGSYSVTVTDDHNCQATGTATVSIDYIYDNVYVWADPDTIWEGQSSTLHSTPIPGVSYSWTPTIWLDNPGSDSPVATPPPGVYWYYIYMDDGNGCVYTDSLRIVVLDVFCYDPYLYLPNAFTPDNDGVNDILYVRGIYIEELEFLIFDRWGTLIFETRNQNVGWDGTYNNKPVEPGVYAYYLKIICFNQLIYTKKGNITLIR
jgi:gliding motility-associated-like protein